MPPDLQCAFSNPLSEDTISDIVDGMADEDALKHLKDCESCRNRVNEARGNELSLRSKLHPSALKLGEYELGYLDSVEAGKIESHVKVCFRCRDEIETLRAFLTDGETAQKMENETKAGSNIPSSNRLLIREPQMAEARVRFSPPQGVAKPHMIEAEQRGIKVSLTWYKARKSLDGQLMPVEAWEGALIMCYQPEGVATTVVDDLGTFQIDQLPGGKARLYIVSTDGRTVALENLDLPT